MRALILEDEPGLLDDFGDCVRELQLNPSSSHGKTNFDVESVKSAAEAKELLRDAGQKAQPYDVMSLASISTGTPTPSHQTLHFLAAQSNGFLVYSTGFSVVLPAN